MIRAIIFDCFGVLTTETWQNFKETLEPRQIAEAQNLMLQSTNGHIGQEEFIDELAKLSHQTRSEIEDALRSDQGKNTKLLEYIAQLKSRGYKIGLLSNIANNWIRDDFLTVEEQGLFDDMVMSFEVGMGKPDPRVYRLVCERLGVEPEEAVMVDDIDRYCAAAEDEGMQAIVYTDFKRFKADLEDISHRK